MVQTASRKKERDEEKVAAMAAPVWIWGFFWRELEKKDSTLCCCHMWKWKSEIKGIGLKTEQENKSSDFYSCDERDMLCLKWARNFLWSLFSAHKLWVSPKVCLKLPTNYNDCLSLFSNIPLGTPWRPHYVAWMKLSNFLT